MSFDVKETLLKTKICYFTHGVYNLWFVIGYWAKPSSGDGDEVGVPFNRSSLSFERAFAFSQKTTTHFSIASFFEKL